MHDSDSESDVWYFVFKKTKYRVTTFFGAPFAIKTFNGSNSGTPVFNVAADIDTQSEYYLPIADNSVQHIITDKLTLSTE